MTQPKTFESYFQTQLAAQASKDEVAAPVTLEALSDSLSRYLSKTQVRRAERAYTFAHEAHEGQVRLTGHPYITHPLAVAKILSDMRLDHQSIVAGLLHDVLEDTGVTKSDLSSSFGNDVAQIVDGVSKLSTIFKSREQAQAENFQKMVMATAKDLRVILVKLADRLHNMRTVGVHASDKRRRIARETLDFYAPIANRLGMYNMKVEFEDLGFGALYPLRADRIRRAVSSARGNRRALMDDLGKSLEAGLRREGIDATVFGREKHHYSIYHKMKMQRKSFADIMDVFGFRIIVDQPEACYRALGVVHNLYKPVAGRFKDYVAIPKTNGYQSLHTTLFGMHGVPMEVQIRTRQMDAVADNGIAGHWLYKSGKASFKGGQTRARQWVKGVLDLQQRAGDTLEFIESLKVDLFPDEVYVFTPKGDILELPRGACPIDFAYAVHTDIGNRCVTCRVDRMLAPLSWQLQSGQSVEIITSKDARPSPDWLTFSVSGRARSAIRQALKAQKKSESIDLGRRLLNRSLANANTSISNLDFRRLRKVFREFDVRKLDDLLTEIGLGNLTAYVVAQHLLAAENPDYEAVNIEQGGPVAIRDGGGLVINYARCCGPVPGDAVVGHMTPERGFVVHAEICPNMEEVRRRRPHDIIPARWATATSGEFDTALLVTINRRKGIIAEVAATINDCDAGINNIKVDERDAELSSVTMELSVADREHVNRVKQRLQAIPAVQSVSRANK
jgi:guanosine-3',5'-bis(diphosphate) 3'-pyrophosphohydrolase